MKQSPFVIGGRLNLGTGFASALAHAAKSNEESSTEEVILASMGDDTILASVSDLAEKQMRALAASIALEFSMGDVTTYEHLESLIIASVDDPDDDEEVELDEDEQEEFNELLSVVADALVIFSGKDIKLVQQAIESESDDLLESIAAKAVEMTKDQNTSELVADFAVREELILSAMKKVVRGGKLVLKKVKKTKKRASAAVRAALKKARRKAHSSAAKAKRGKSNRLREKRGL